VPSIIGSMKIRSCDHQAEVPEYVGTVSGSGDSSYGGIHLYDQPVFVAPFDKIALTCSEATAQQP
jgi:branched-chain amino acid transport system substrate-binding protein